MKSSIMLVVSQRMISNKKPNRNEDKLIRMSNQARSHLGLKGEESVELWPDTTTRDRINRSRMLDIFKAFSSDIKKLRDSGMSEKDMRRVGFVTQRTFDYLCKNVEKENIWITNTIEDTVIGTDPEFILREENGLIKYAAHVDGLYREDRLGSDGPWAEVRPNPEVSIENLVKDIQSIFKKDPKTKLIEHYQWLGGCYYEGRQTGRYATNRTRWPLGGHIHVGTPLKLSKAFEGKRVPYERLVFDCMQKILDENVAVPLMKVESKKESTRRREEYGQFYQGQRPKEGRREYRTISGIWLVHPEMAKAVLGTVKAITHSIYKLIEQSEFDPKFVAIKDIPPSKTPQNFFNDRFDGWKDIELTKMMGAITSSERMINILHRGDITFDKKFLNTLRSKLTSIEMYKQYSKYIDRFIEIVSLPNSELRQIDKDLKNTWVAGDKFII